MKKIIIFEKYKQFSVHFLAILVMILLIFIVLLPKVKEVLSINTRILSQKKELGFLTEKLADLQSISETELYDSTVLLMAALPADKDFYSVLNSLKKSFEESSVTLESFSISPGGISSDSSQLKPDAKNPVKNDEKQSSKMLVKLAFLSQDYNLKDLFRRIENSFPLTEVSSMKLSSMGLSSATASGVYRYSGEMFINSFSLPLPKSLGKAASPLPKILKADQKLIEELKNFNSPSLGVFLNETIILGKDNPFPF